MAFTKFIKSILPKHKPIYECTDSVQYAITSKQLRQLELRTPSHQADIDPDRVRLIQEASAARPAYDLSKNHISIAVRLGARGRAACMMLMDGQHRREATMERDDFPFIVTFQHTPTDDDARELFRHINMDSHKNREFISLNSTDAKLADDLYDYLKRTREVYFSDGKHKKIMSIREFVDLLGERYLSRFSTFEALQAHFDSTVAAFASSVEGFLDCCYAEEKKCCADQFLAPLRESNFVAVLVDAATPYYVGKKKGPRSVCAALKNAVWLKRFPTETEGKCWCCKKATIGVRNFDCGHVISVFDGGKTSLDNLEPICGACNSSMGKKNLYVFQSECGF